MSWGYSPSNSTSLVNVRRRAGADLIADAHWTAEVLAADGTLPLVLDDALVNTDPERIRRIQRLLFRAADTLQSPVSCHDVLFDGLGAEFVRQLGRRRH